MKFRYFNCFMELFDLAYLTRQQVKRVSMGLTVNHQMAKNLAVDRQKYNIFTVKLSTPILAVKCLRYR